MYVRIPSPSINPCPLLIHIRPPNQEPLGFSSPFSPIEPSDFSLCRSLIISFPLSPNMIPPIGPPLSLLLLSRADPPIVGFAAEDCCRDLFAFDACRDLISDTKAAIRVASAVCRARHVSLRIEP